MEVLVLIRRENADSCGQKDTPKPYLLLSAVLSMKNKYVPSFISEKKKLAKYCCRKVKSKPITLEKVFSSPIYGTSATAPSCLHVPSLCWQCPVLPCFKPERWEGLICPQNITQPISFHLKAILAPRNTMQQEGTCAGTRLGAGCHGTEVR